MASSHESRGFGSACRPWIVLRCILVVALAGFALGAPMDDRVEGAEPSSTSAHSDPPITVERLVFADALATEEPISVPVAERPDVELDAEGNDTIAVRIGAPLMFGVCSLTELAIECSPDEAEVGIDCGMEWMCGLDPCLCGAADERGKCACNGTTTQKATFSWSLEGESVANIVDLFGRTYLLARHPGEADLRCVVSLDDHRSARVRIPIEVTLADSGAVSYVRAVAAFGLALVGGIAGLVAHSRKRKGKAAS